MVLPIFLLSAAVAALAGQPPGRRRPTPARARAGSGAREAYGGAQDLIFPLESDTRVVTSPFGWRMHPVYRERRLHEGVDLRAAQGTPVLAPADGVVAYTTSTGACGWGVCIEHSPTLRSLFCHLSRKDVREGQVVHQGDQVGLSGGRPGHPGAGTSTAPHLHFAVHTRPASGGQWRPVDPLPLLQEPQDQAPVTHEPSPEEESWFDSLMAFFWGSEEEAPGARWDCAPGAQGILIGADGVQYSPGTVPAGRYRLVVPGKPDQTVELESGRDYRLSSVGRIFPIG